MRSFPGDAGPPAPLTVLLVEDDPGDVVLITEALRERGRNPRLHTVSDGAEAVSFLYRAGEHSSAPRPDVVLLDLNLPRMDGREVLAHIKSDPDLRSIPVVVLTTSDATEDIVRTYQSHANAYLTKPVDPDDFSTLVNRVDEFYRDVARLPRQGR
ncbi:response regulator [Actinosynnema sp. NPDC050436]|uniref:response regulator n=1 Tax=Actinosynnema sp. NPDC050436 TaxID=3155659 RepID=UPI0033E67E6B